MQYIQILLFAILFYLSFTFVFNLFTKQTLKENLKICGISLLVVIPFAMLIFAITFGLLWCAKSLDLIEISNFIAFSVSMLSIFVIFATEFIVKMMTSTFFGAILGRKHQEDDLSDDDMAKIIQSKKPLMSFIKTLLTISFSIGIMYIILFISGISKDILISLVTCLSTLIVGAILFKSA